MYQVAGRYQAAHPGLKPVDLVGKPPVHRVRRSKDEVGTLRSLSTKKANAYQLANKKTAKLKAQKLRRKLARKLAHSFRKTARLKSDFREFKRKSIAEFGYVSAQGDSFHAVVKAKAFWSKQERRKAEAIRIIVTAVKEKGFTERKPAIELARAKIQILSPHIKNSVQHFLESNHWRPLFN